MTTRTGCPRPATALLLISFLGALIARPATAQTYEVLHRFAPEVINPESGLLRDAAGSLYGISTGDDTNAGAILKLDPTGVLTGLYVFGLGCSRFPHGPLVQDGSGNLYGTTEEGYQGAPGTIFRIDPDGTLRTLYGFSGFDGAYPRSGLIRDASGNLYGTTSEGGPTNRGTVFKLDTSGVLSVLHNFDMWDGALPSAGVTRDESGNLFGTTYMGGADNFGTVFRLDPAGNFALLHSFSGSDGANPTAALILDGSGNLFGTTSRGGAYGHGSVFKIDHAGQFSLLDSFGSGGRYPYGALVQDASGNLYGTTEQGGADGCGTIFKVDESGSLTLLHSFDCKGEGAYPRGALIFDDSGNLYGTTTYFYNFDFFGTGTIFRLESSGTLSTLYAFGGAPTPNPGLISDESGNLYGTSCRGGTNSLGMVFKTDTAGAVTILHNFSGPEGACPYAGVVRDAAGTLYGATTKGGAALRGTIFKLDGAGTFTSLWNFGGPDGARPTSLTRDGAGNLYGMTLEGGDSSYGTIFKLDTSETLTTLHSFDGSEGPPAYAAALVLDGSGNLHGTTPQGGPGGYGMIFELDTFLTFTPLWVFNFSDGTGPVATLVRDQAGSLYGTTNYGGPNGFGTVFKLDTSGVLTTLYSFDAADGSSPYALVLDGNDIYGTTLGPNGTIFKLDSNGVLTTLHDFWQGAGGSRPNSLIRAASGDFYGTASVLFRLSLTSDPLTISSIKPSSGPFWGQTIFTVRGTAFSEDTALLVGGSEWATYGSVDSIDSTELDACPWPDALVPGTLNDVTVRNPSASPGSEATLAKGFFADFLDVPQGDIFHGYVESIFRNGISAGCGGGDYCRNNPVRRDQMAVFLLKAEHGANYLPPACNGIFADVPCPGAFADWIEQLATERITGGCGGSNYCPSNPVTRAQMAAFLLKAQHGSAYLPPACNGMFTDVTCPSLFADWIEQLAIEQITGGCGSGNYCPNNPNTRGQMAAFLVKTFGLQ